MLKGFINIIYDQTSLEEKLKAKEKKSEGILMKGYNHIYIYIFIYLYLYYKKKRFFIKARSKGKDVEEKVVCIEG